MRKGKLAVGDELAGTLVSVQIDGGRMKIRGKTSLKQKKAEAVDEDGLLIEDAPGRSRKKPKRTYPADWREPKSVTLFGLTDEETLLARSLVETTDERFFYRRNSCAHRIMSSPRS